MPNGRDWRSFNETWRNRQAEQNLSRCLGALGWLGGASHRFVKEAEPWGILFAVVGLFLSLLAFAFDYRDKVEERTVRAWQLVTTKAPGNSGKTEALEYLNRIDGFWCAGEECLITLKARTALTGVDLSLQDEQKNTDLRGPYLREADLGGADLSYADLSGADLDGADLSDAFLGDANLRGASFSNANLSEAYLGDADLSNAHLFETNLSGAGLYNANLSEAYLEDADLSNATLAEANLNKADLSGADLRRVRAVEQEQLDMACGDEDTQFPKGLIIPMCSEVDWFEKVHGNDE